tara:strand:- start:163 stop:324 length:162 start_codon:yes stop_codon:yes gene_type:complete
MWFRGTPYITSIGLFYKNREVCGGLSDCEELVGVLTGDDECGVGSEERCCNRQ